jgi:hypothetical protein
MKLSFVNAVVLPVVAISPAGFGGECVLLDVRAGIETIDAPFQAAACPDAGRES